MPKGIPTAEQLMSGMVGGFSIDTCIFESVGFNLESGEFGVLRQQLPPWLELNTPRIVIREVIGHQEANVRKAEQELNNSMRNIHRYSDVNVAAISTAVAARVGRNNQRALRRMSTPSFGAMRFAYCTLHLPH